MPLKIAKSVSETKRMVRQLKCEEVVMVNWLGRRSLLFNVPNGAAAFLFWHVSVDLW
jgi:hypothetical protein